MENSLTTQKSSLKDALAKIQSQEIDDRELNARIQSVDKRITLDNKMLVQQEGTRIAWDKIEMMERQAQKTAETIDELYALKDLLQARYANTPLAQLDPTYKEESMGILSRIQSLKGTLADELRLLDELMESRGGRIDSKGSLLTINQTTVNVPNLRSPQSHYKLQEKQEETITDVDVVSPFEQ